MRFSPPFDNTAPASVTPSRGAAFTHFKPQGEFQSYAYFEGYDYPAWSPANATAQTVNGIILPSPYAIYPTEPATGSLSGVTFGNGYSVVITPQTVFPLLLATAGGFSFYATTAGVQYLQDPQTLIRYVLISGSLQITGPNGYTSIGWFEWYIPTDANDTTSPLPAPSDVTSLQFWAQEAGLTARQSNTAPATNTSFPRSQLRASPDNSLPATKFQSWIQWAVAGAAAFSPSNAVAPQLRNGLILGNEPENGARFFTGTGNFLSVPDGRLYSIAITPQTTYPLLLATAGGFSFYATNAGVTNNAYGPPFNTSTLRINGSAFITGPNGYSARGSFQWFANNNPEESGNAPGDPTYLEVWADETGLAAQPTNTPPQPRQ